MFESLDECGVLRWIYCVPQQLCIQMYFSIETGDQCYSYAHAMMQCLTQQLFSYSSTLSLARPRPPQPCFNKCDIGRYPHMESKLIMTN